MMHVARFALVAALLAPAAALAGESAVSAADRQAILDIATQHDAALNRNDAAAAAAVFTEDAVVVPPGPSFTGRDAIQKDMEKGIKNGYADHASTVDQVHVAGDFAWTTGGWSMTVPGPDGTRRALHGNYSTIDQRDGGAWKVRALTYNLILPPPPAQSASK